MIWLCPKCGSEFQNPYPNRSEAAFKTGAEAMRHAALKAIDDIVCGGCVPQDYLDAVRDAPLPEPPK
jgi:hypothetical protein